VTKSTIIKCCIDLILHVVSTQVCEQFVCFGSSNNVAQLVMPSGFFIYRQSLPLMKSLKHQ